MSIDQEYGLDGEPIQPAVEAHTDAVEFPEAEQQQLQQAVVALEWLRDLKYTIARKGVSQTDVQAVLDIRASLEHLEFDAEPALEHYNVRAYTDDRSGVNLSVATESLGRTIINVIKAMLRKLAEYINKIVRWARHAFTGEKLVVRELAQAIKRVEFLRTSNRKMVAEYGAAPAFTSNQAKYVEQLLTQHKLPLNDVTMALLGARRKERDALTGTLVELEPAVSIPVDVAELLTRFLTTDADTVLDDVSRLRVFDRLKMELGLQLSETANPTEMVKTLGNDVFELRLHPLLTTVTPYDYMIKSCESINDQLRKVNRFRETNDLDPVVNVINGLSKSVDDIAHLAKNVMAINKQRLRVLDLIYIYENMRFTQLVDHIKVQVAGTAKEAVFGKLTAEVAKFIKTTME